MFFSLGLSIAFALHISFSNVETEQSDRIQYRGAVAQSVERATPGEESCVRSQLWPPAPYWFGRCQYNVTGSHRGHGLPALSRVWQHVKLSDVSLGTHPPYSLVVDEDVKKPSKQTCIKYNYMVPVFNF